MKERYLICRVKYILFYFYAKFFLYIHIYFIAKDCYNEEKFDMGDVVKISRRITNELFDYVDAPDYLKEMVRDYDEYEKDNFDIDR